jgi:hypothetical protein
VRKAIALCGKGQLYQAIEAYGSSLKLDNNEAVQHRVKELEKKFCKLSHYLLFARDMVDSEVTSLNVDQPKHRARPRRALEIETNLETW